MAETLVGLSFVVILLGPVVLAVRADLDGPFPD